MIGLETPIEKLAHVGPRNLPRLKRLNIKTVRDLLWHIPARYEDLSLVVPIAKAQPGETVSVRGEVTEIDNALFWRRRKKLAVTSAVIEDESGPINAVWFNQPFIKEQLPRGSLVSLAGKVSIGKNGLCLSAPHYEKISMSGKELTHTGRLIPIYPETEGITSKYLRFLIKPLIASTRFLPDPLPLEILQKQDLPPLNEAISSIHFPKTIQQAEMARKRFAFEELLLFQLRLLRDRRRLKALRAPSINFNKKLVAGFVKKLPFELTGDQRIAAYEILQDLARPYPMNRLLNGDVGSGKTVVALIAAYEAMIAGFQAVFMAPTEILAKQHFSTITSLLEAQKQGSLAQSEISYKQAKIRIGLLTGSEVKLWPEEKIAKKSLYKKISDGGIDLIIGTHAVIQKNVKFKNLCFVVIDEQHRFGVEQRMALAKGKGVDYKQAFVPHLLSMTATPIPRTLALTMYGDLEISLLKEKPKGRQPIITRIIPHNKKEAAYGFIEKQIADGRQVFVICPRIEASEKASSGNIGRSGQQTFFNKNLFSAKKLLWAEVKAVTAEFKELSEKIFPARKIAMLHGKMKAAEKDRIMNDFRGGHYDILVSTSVVEVGVDVPNAAVMMIESAERFGFAQLHQFRGRIGRGGQQSYCFLFTSSSDIPANRRLRTLEKTESGFELAEMDLKLRGPGEFAGIRQSGIPDFAMASLADIELIKKARLEARLLLKDDPALSRYPLLLTRLNQMQRVVHFE